MCSVGPSVMQCRPGRHLLQSQNTDRVGMSVWVNNIAIHGSVFLSLLIQENTVSLTVRFIKWERSVEFSILQGNSRLIQWNQYQKGTYWLYRNNISPREDSRGLQGGPCRHLMLSARGSTWAGAGSRPKDAFQQQGAEMDFKEEQGLPNTRAKFTHTK